jgi:integrase
MIRRTKSGLPTKYCGWNADRHGTRRVRFRKSGFTSYLTGIPWSETFMREYATALEGVKAQASEIGAGRTIPGSISALVTSFYRAPEFRALKASTQVERPYVLERFRAEHGLKPVRLLKRKHIADIIGAKANTPGAANNLLKALRTLLAYAITIDMIEVNPAAGLKKFKLSDEGFRRWEDHEVEQFRARHPLGTKARLALELLVHTGQRRGDIVRMGWQHMVSADEIALRQEKTGAALVVALHPELLEALALVPKSNLTFLLTEYGAPFTPTGFGNWFRERCNEAGLSQCSAHGLRKTHLVRRANAGGTTDHLKASGGHKSLSEVAHYTRGVDQRRLARQALDLQLRAEAERREQKQPENLSSPPSGWTKRSLSN